MAKLTAVERIRRARAQLIFDQPFFGSLALRRWTQHGPSIAVFDTARYVEVWTGQLSRFASDNDLDAGQLLSDLIACQETEGRTPEPLTIGGGAAPEFDISLID